MGGVEFIGKVVSNRMQKTVVVAVSYVVWVPKYKVYQKRISRHMAHDAQQTCNIGDVIRIHKSRKYSKHKSYRVLDVLRRASVFLPQQAAALVAARDTARPVDAVTAAQQRLGEVEGRLAALREMYQKELGSSSMTGEVFRGHQSAVQPAGTGSSNGGDDDEVDLEEAGQQETDSKIVPTPS